MGARSGAAVKRGRGRRPSVIAVVVGALSLAAGCGAGGRAGESAAPETTTNRAAAWVSTAPADFDRLYQILAEAGRAVGNSLKTTGTQASTVARCEIWMRDVEELAVRLVPVPDAVALDGSQKEFISKLTDQTRRGLALCEKGSLFDGLKAMGEGGDRADAEVIRVRDALKRL